MVVPLVEPDAGLVEHVQHSDQARADLGREPDALRLAARQRSGRPVEREVVQADVDEELQPLVDLLEHAGGDGGVAIREPQSPQHVGRLADRQGGDVGDAVVLDGDGQGDGLQPRAGAGSTGHLAHEALEALTARVAVGLRVPSLHERDDALVRRVVRALPAVPVLVADVDLGRVPVQERGARLGRQGLPGSVHADVELVAHGLEQAPEVVGHLAARPRRQCALGQRQLVVGDDQLRIDLAAGAEPGAHRAGSERGVERERPRLELLEGEPVPMAGQVLAERALPVGVGVVEVHELQHDEAAGQAEGGLHRVGEAATRLRLDGESVDDHLDRVLLLLLEDGDVVEPQHDPVDPHPGVALGHELAEEVGVLALALAHHRRQDLEPGSGGQLEHLVDDLLRRLAGDDVAADRAVRDPDARVQQAQVVVDLGDGAHGRPRVAGGGLLVDRHRRGQALDEVDVGLVHLAEELAGVGRQALHVPALALGEDRVEGEARLAGPGEAGEHDQGIPGQVEGHVLEVVLAGTAHDQSLAHRRSSPGDMVRRQ